MTQNLVIDAKQISNHFGDHWVHQGVDFSVKRGDIVAIVGGSGSGKTTLLRNLLLLRQPNSGSIRLFNADALACSQQQANALRARLGVMFQSSALFSSLTVLENITFPLHERTALKATDCCELASYKLLWSGLKAGDAHKYPAELSGGMLKRAALARAIALDPELLFLDEPTAGLDPKSASAMDELVLNLRDSLDLTIVVVTHDLDTLWRISDQVAFLGEGKVLAIAPINELVHHSHPLIQDYFASERSRRFITTE